MATAARDLQLSDAQRAAIFAPAGLQVRAGAGSGKTEVLARRVVALLAGDIEGRPPLNPSQIVAITFTDKAALDMNLRIIAVLKARAAAEPDAARRTQLKRALKTIWLARISTIHAFCARLLREQAVTVGLDPDFKILDEDESAAFFEQIALDALVRAMRQDDPGARFLVQSRGLRGGIFREGALEIAQRLTTEAARRGVPLAQVLAATANTVSTLAGQPDRVADGARQLVLIVDQLCRAAASGQTATALRELAALWKSARAVVQGLHRDSPSEEIEVLRTLAAHLPEARSNAVKDLVKAAKELVAEDDTRFGLTGELIAAWGDYRAAPRALAIARLLVTLDSAIAEARRADRIMTFDDLLIATRDLLRDHPEVTAHYRRELRAILVDEYQDTNALQDQIIRLLATPDPGGAAAPQLFVVGDEKQSIYRFRGADVAVFNAPWPFALETSLLQDNRRSTPTIVNFVNALGSAMMPPGTGPSPAYAIAWSSAHELEARRAVAHDYPVEVLLGSFTDDGVSLSVAARREREARALAARVRELVASGDPVLDPATGEYRPVRLRDIVLLLRAFTDVGLYERAFAEYGIDSYTVNGRGFYHRPEVLDLIQLMAAIADPRDTIALAAALRSPLFGLSDRALMRLCLGADEGRKEVTLADSFGSQRPDFTILGDEAAVAEAAFTTLNELRRQRGRLGLAAFIERILELTDYESVMAGMPQGRQRVANLRKLVEIARRCDSRNVFTFASFVSYLRRLTEVEPYEPQGQVLEETDDVVRLMTIHQAKGLEFPVVILGDAGRRPTADHFPVLLDPDAGVLVRETCGSGHDEIPSAAFDRYTERVSDEQAAELLRILYVALTRARDRLIISEGADNAGWSKMLREFLGRELCEDFLRTGRETRLVKRDGFKILLRRPSAAEAPSPPPQPELPLLDGGLARRLRDRAAFTPEAPHELTLSVTALADFARCPRQYWLRHAVRLPVNGGGSAGVPATTAMGTVAHRILELLEFDQAAATAVPGLAEQIGRSAGLGAEERRRVADDLVRYLNSPRQAEVVVCGREVPFIINPASGLFLRGRIDVIARDNTRPGHLIVRDYKYSRAVEASLYQVQMECYALAVASVMPEVTVTAEIVALRGKVQIQSLELPALPVITAHLATLAEELRVAEAAANFPRRPPAPAACRALGCEYLDLCWKR